MYICIYVCVYICICICIWICICICICICPGRQASVQSWLGIQRTIASVRACECNQIVCGEVVDVSLLVADVSSSPPCIVTDGSSRIFCCMRNLLPNHCRLVNTNNRFQVCIALGEGAEKKSRKKYGLYSFAKPERRGGVTQNHTPILKKFLGTR